MNLRQHTIPRGVPRRRRLSGWLLPALVVLGLPAAAAVPQPVAQMLDNAPAAAESRCSYTRIRIGDEVRRERYVAGQEPPWTLLSVDGNPPTSVELRHYARGQEERDRRHPLAFDLRGMVDPEHWRLRDRDGDEAVYEFRLRPNEDLDESLVDKVRGTLIMDAASHQPVRIVIENTEAAYIAPFVRVAEYRQQLDFEWNDAVGAAVLTQTETRVRGRAVGFKVLRRDKLVRYTDYACADGADETVAATAG